MIAIISVAAAVLVSGAFLLVTVGALRVALQLRAQLGTARQELLGCLAHIAAADAEEERLRQAVDDQIQLRAGDLQTFRAEIAELRENYEQTIEKYHRTFGRSAIDQALTRRRVH